MQQFAYTTKQKSTMITCQSARNLPNLYCLKDDKKITLLCFFFVYYCKCEKITLLTNIIGFIFVP